MTNYQRTVPQLREVASLFWPAELSKEAAQLSVLPLLLETQGQFLSILGVDLPSPQHYFNLINDANLPTNQFLKHLMVLADFGGELLQRVNKNFSLLFPERQLEYEWRGKTYQYTFHALPIARSLNNDRLGVSGKKLVQGQRTNILLHDVIAILIFGSVCTNPEIAEVLTQCEISHYLGQTKELENFVKERYLWVSRIVAGSKSNNLGQLAQKFVQKYLVDHLHVPGVTIKPNGHLPGVAHTDKATNRLTSFDIVVSRDDRFVAIEVSFQVTTNSVVERKSGQAQARYQQINDAGYKIAYVLDGAGNFQRVSALSTICAYSHCNVAFSSDELNLLCDFIREYLQ
ncbi:MAG: restriction endonuclease [Chloroflexi bacterium]|nr:restriction endonuclease [Chloroflexota bacterium]MBP8054344.1 restriction endonuclease [Chloroflexota bacterium]